MSASKAERGTLWADEEVMALIGIWVDEGIQQQLDSCARKRPIFEKIARRMHEEGEYIRTFAQVREKIKQLKQAYKKIKDSNNKQQKIKDSNSNNNIIAKPPSTLKASKKLGRQANNKTRKPS